MTNEQIKKEIAAYIKKHFVYDERRVIGDDDPFLTSGILDSTGIIELIAFLEETYKVHFEDEELVAENFDTLARLAVFMEEKISARTEGRKEQA